jgi:hypothetical protein
MLSGGGKQAVKVVLVGQAQSTTKVVERLLFSQNKLIRSWQGPSHGQRFLE